ncbi:hypothetical protein ACFY1S_27595 [Micromonospora sp. NPDC000663]|uniref:hypothetical protein n=1 Tax=Micromonospora sp. NPDC000663 TaxID=3364218 RepID=UPI003691ABCA
MTNERVRSLGGYFMRLLGGVAVIVGILGFFATLTEGNLVGLVLSVIFVVGGAVALKRSGGTRRAREIA